MSEFASGNVISERLHSGVLEDVSLYVSLEPGTRAALEVIARASLEFASLVREIAFVIDPSIEIRIEIESGTRGSLSLNSVLRFFRIEDEKARRNVKSIAIAAALFFVQEPASWALGKILDQFFTAEEKAQLSQSEIDEIARKAAEAVQRRIGESQAERVYRELQTDPAINGVAVTRERDRTPTEIVPRSEFLNRAGSVREEVEGASRRTRDEIVTLQLISPVLIDSTSRSWRFRGASGDFGAIMKDERFVSDLIHGRTAVTMSGGILMEVELRTIEEKSKGVWQIKSRSILKVRQVRQPASQANLNLPGRP